MDGPTRTVYYHLVRDPSWILTANACVREASRKNDSDIATARFELAALMQEEIESTIGSLGDNHVIDPLFIDLIWPVIEEIDWTEIADCFLDDLDDFEEDPSNITDDPSVS